MATIIRFKITAAGLKRAKSKLRAAAAISLVNESSTSEHNILKYLSKFQRQGRTRAQITKDRSAVTVFGRGGRSAIVSVALRNLLRKELIARSA